MQRSPILVGHHSERHARKDAERIQNGMRKTVQMWKTARYWEDRAAGALRHAKYKELPAVRYRRIKGIEADLRKEQRNVAEAEKYLKAWNACAEIADPEKRLAVARQIANYCNLNLSRKEGDSDRLSYQPSAYDVLRDEPSSLYVPRTIDEVFAAAREAYPKTIARCERWIEHYTLRIAYDKAMLGESGGIKANAFDFAIGGKVLIGSEWLVILKINKTGESVSTLTTTPPARWWGSKHKAEITAVKDYQAPVPEETAAVKAATKLPPMCNYPGEGFKHMTKAEWDRAKMSDVRQSETIKATDTLGAHRVRSTFASGWKTVCVFLSDQKRVDPPTLAPSGAPETLRTMAADLRAQNPLPVPCAPRKRDERIPSHEDLSNLKTAAAEGVQVVVVPQLFPTPHELAVRMVEIANIQPPMRILEPSAGTGTIVNVIPIGTHLQAVEINAEAARMLGRTKTHPCCYIHTGDFLEWSQVTDERFDRVLMNPPFANNQDIRHVRAAFDLLREGGRLVAIMSPHFTFAQDKESVAFREWFEDLGGTYEKLPADTFKASGTSVNTVLVTIDR